MRTSAAPAERRGIIFARAAMVTLIAIAATFALSFSTSAFLEHEMDWFCWIECSVIAIAISMPASLYIFWHKQRYSATCSALLLSHDTLKRTHEKLTYSATHDPATGLLNRDAFVKRLARPRMDGECDTLLLIGADNFTRINDRFGHAHGDEILNRLARALLYCTRRSDIVGRTSGTEFGVILRDVCKDAAMSRAEVIRRHAEIIPLVKSGRGGLKVSVSIGGAEMRDGAEIGETLRRASRCLCEAKRRGRNRVSFTDNASGWVTSAQRPRGSLHFD